MFHYVYAHQFEAAKTNRRLVRESLSGVRWDVFRYTIEKRLSEIGRHQKSRSGLNDPNKTKTSDILMTWFIMGKKCLDFDLDYPDKTWPDLEDDMKMEEHDFIILYRKPSLYSSRLYVPEYELLTTEEEKMQYICKINDPKFRPQQHQSCFIDTVPSWYLCNRCGERGNHTTINCQLETETQHRQKRISGIPLSSFRSATPSEIPDAWQSQDGRFWMPRKAQA